jgi:uncharacterized membrane protein
VSQMTRNARLLAYARVANIATAIGIGVSHLWFAYGYFYVAMVLGRWPRRHVDDPKKFGICEDSSTVLAFLLAEMVLTVVGLLLALAVLGLTGKRWPLSARAALSVSCFSIILWWFTPWAGWCLD